MNIHSIKLNLIIRSKTRFSISLFYKLVLFKLNQNANIYLVIMWNIIGIWILPLIIWRIELVNSKLRNNYFYYYIPGTDTANILVLRTGFELAIYEFITCEL